MDRVLVSGSELSIMPTTRYQLFHDAGRATRALFGGGIQNKGLQSTGERFVIRQNAMAGLDQIISSKKMLRSVVNRGLQSTVAQTAVVITRPTGRHLVRAKVFTRSLLS